jgi:dUTP pyrophosphatase
MLRVKLLASGAKLPEVAHPGEDLGFDVFALEDTVLPFGVTIPVRTGIAANFVLSEVDRKSKFGLIIKDRSSMAAKGIKTSAGVIDSGYTDELKVLMTNHNPDHVHFGDYSSHVGAYRADPFYNNVSNEWEYRKQGYVIKAGDKIAQLVPTEVFTAGTIVEVDDLGQTARGAAGFGSSGS